MRRTAICLCVIGLIASVVLITRAAGVVSNNDDLLAFVKQGCSQAVASVDSGMGKVVVNTTYSTDKDVNLVTERTYDARFVGKRFRCSEHTTYIRNDHADISTPAVYRYWVQAGAFGDKDNADRLVADLRGHGFSAQSKSVATADGRALYRVQIGPFPTRNEARTVADDLLVKGHTSTVASEVVSVAWEPGMAVPPGTERERLKASDGQTVISYLPGEKRAEIMDAAPATGDGYASVLAFQDDVIPMLRGVVDIANIEKHIWHVSGYEMQSPRIVGREDVGGDSCIVVEIVWIKPADASHSSLTNTHQFWVAPDKGFTVPRIRVWQEGGLFWEKTLVAATDVDMRQYPGGVWGPAKVTADEYGISQATGSVYHQMHKVITYDPGFQFGLSVANEELQLTLPSGTKVYDQLMDANYTMP